MKSAIRDNNPVVVFEDQILAASAKGPVLEEEYTVPIGVADVKREGRDVTVIAIAKMVPEALWHEELLPRRDRRGSGRPQNASCPWTRRHCAPQCARQAAWSSSMKRMTCSAAAEIMALLTEDPATFRALKMPPGGSVRLDAHPL